MKYNNKNIKQTIEHLTKNNDVNGILTLIYKREADYLQTINKLKRKRLIEVRRIKGALKQTINAHGPITKILIGSASKRIYGALLEMPKKSLLDKIKKFFKI